MKILLTAVLSIILASNALAVTGTVSSDDMKLSLADGVAFVDFSSPNVLTAYAGKKITICSVTSPTQCAVGYIKAAGTGETYTDLIGGSSPALKNGDFEAGAVDWTIGTGWAISGGIATGTTVGNNWLRQTVITGSRFLKLYRITYTISTSSGRLRPQVGQLVYKDRTTSGTFSDYLCYPSSGGNYEIGFASTGDVNTWSGTLDNVSAQVVNAPSNTGVTIVSTEGGATRNWESKTFTTATNDPAGYTYTIDALNYSLTISGNNSTLSYGLVDCGDVADMAGVLVTGSGNTIKNYTVVRCPGGAFQFDESATLINSIGISIGADITIAAGKTVTGKNNLFGDAAKTGDGTYTDVGAATQWSTDPVFVDPANGNFRLQSTSPAIDAGTR